MAENYWRPRGGGSGIIGKKRNLRIIRISSNENHQIIKSENRRFDNFPTISQNFCKNKQMPFDENFLTV